jgi:hypothetical protein
MTVKYAKNNITRLHKTYHNKDFWLCTKIPSGNPVQFPKEKTFN